MPPGVNGVRKTIRTLSITNVPEQLTRFRLLGYKRCLAMTFRNTDILLIASLLLLAVGSLGLRFHFDFFAGLGIAAAVVMMATAARKRARSGLR